jgi:Helicase associated domain
MERILPSARLLQSRREGKPQCTSRLHMQGRLQRPKGHAFGARKVGPATKGSAFALLHNEPAEQPSECNKLRIRKLQTIGFVFNEQPAEDGRKEQQQKSRPSNNEPQTRLGWDGHYQLVQAYLAKHQNLAIPYRFVTPEGVRLGNWASEQRQVYSRQLNGRVNSVSQARIDLLDSLGFPWTLREKRLPWMDYYRLLVDYKDKHGHLDIKPSHKTDDGVRVGHWVKNQRLLYAKKLRMEQTPGQVVVKGNRCTISNGRSFEQN